MVINTGPREHHIYVFWCQARRVGMAKLVIYIINQISIISKHLNGVFLLIFTIKLYLMEVL